MCLGTPARVVSIEEGESIAYVDFGDGVPRPVVIGISKDEIKPGDVVIVHAGIIISKLDSKELLDSYKRLLAELAHASGEDVDSVLREFEELIR